METETITTSLEAARKLYIYRQYLAGNPPKGSFSEKLKTIIRDTGYIQWDPVTVLAPSHLISIWSRIGNFKWAELDRMMWQDRDAFFHWTPVAWIVLTEDYPLFNSLMKNYPDSMRKGWSSHIGPASKFLQDHRELRERVVNHLKKGPAETSQFKGFGQRRKSVDGWSSGNDVVQLLFHMHMAGEVMVAGHSGNQNVWALTEDFLPQWAEKSVLPSGELERRTAMRSLKALGVAPEVDINRYFIRGRYSDLKGALLSLVQDGEAVRIKMGGQAASRPLYLRAEDKPMLDSIMSDRWEDRLSLLSPFDNMITLRDRAKRMFGFDYTLEQFVPKEKRKFGTYVLPILWGHRLVGRIDAKMDRRKMCLNIKAVYAEPGYGEERSIGPLLQEKISDLGRFLDAENIVYGDKKPAGWAGSLS